VIYNLHEPTLSLHLIHNINKQKGGADCGLFVIAIATTLAVRLEITFQQSNLRNHLLIYLCSLVANNIYSISPKPYIKWIYW